MIAPVYIVQCLDTFEFLCPNEDSLVGFTLSFFLWIMDADASFILWGVTLIKVVLFTLFLVLCLVLVLLLVLFLFLFFFCLFRGNLRFPHLSLWWMLNALVVCLLILHFNSYLGASPQTPSLTCDAARVRSHASLWHLTLSAECLCRLKKVKGVFIKIVYFVALRKQSLQSVPLDCL